MTRLRSAAESIEPLEMMIAVLIGLAALGCGGPASPDPAAAQAPARASSAAPDEAPAPDLQERYADDPAIEVRRGRASYYNDRLAGRSTASGEPYDPRAFTAASRDLAFGTIVRVVREDTGASVIVRVNDRGPHGDRRRILDLSRAAAERLDMIRAGVVAIRAEVVEVPDRR